MTEMPVTRKALKTDPFRQLTKPQDTAISMGPARLKWKRFLCAILCGMICMGAGMAVSSAEAECLCKQAECLCKQAEPVVVPGPTPKPMPLQVGGVPAMSLSLYGMPAKEWVEDFYRYLAVHKVPVSSEEFELITKFEDESLPGVLFSRYRMWAGGCEVFIQTVDNETINDWVVFFNDEAATTKQMRETLLYYFPLVMQAGVYASEETITLAETQRIVEMLHPDIRSMVLLEEAIDKQIRPNRTYYTLRNEPQYEHMVGFGCWEK